MPARARFSGFSGMFVLAGVLALLLGILAVLQYRWVGQLSADERDRIKDHLHDTADEFAEDFNRELTRAFFWLQVGPVVRPDDVPEPDDARYERWFATAEHPELIAAIYQVDLDEAGRVAAFRQFVRNQPRLEKIEWPDALESIRTALVERQEAIAKASSSTNGSQGGPSGGPGGGPGDARFGPIPRVALLWPDVPAIVMPRFRIVSNTQVSSGNAIGTTRTVTAVGSPPGFTIALLNEQYLRDQFIPRLVDHHFTKGPDGALHVAVTSAHGVVYKTPGSGRSLLDHADVRESLWDIRFHEFGRFVTERRAATADHDREPDRGQDAARDRGTDRGAQADTARATAAPPPPPPAPPVMARQGNITMMYRDDRRGGGRNIVAGPPWKVHLLHGAGSLDAAVGRARSRNLLVSFGVLLLLGTSMTLVFVSSARARRLAAQQMEFVAGVSHELRTPLAVIRSAAENLADGIVDDEKQVRRYGQLIVGEGRRLTQMVEQVMTFAGLHAGRPGFDVRPIDVAPVIDDALSAVAHVTREQDAEIALDVAPGLPRILGDASAVGRALQNLVGNAVKYGGTPPRLEVRARLAPPPRREVDLVVSDNGPGIAPRDLPHIFEPFYRGEDAVARQIHGSGLGLSLVQRIMQELNGRVTVASEPGRGSTFTLHLPIAPEAEAVAHAGSPVPADR